MIGNMTYKDGILSIQGCEGYPPLNCLRLAVMTDKQLDFKREIEDGLERQYERDKLMEVIMGRQMDEKLTEEQQKERKEKIMETLKYLKSKIKSEKQDEQIHWDPPIPYPSHHIKKEN